MEVLLGFIRTRYRNGVETFPGFVRQSAWNYNLRDNHHPLFLSLDQGQYVSSVAFPRHPRDCGSEKDHIYRMVFVVASPYLMHTT